MLVAWDFHTESFGGGGKVSLYLCLYLVTGLVFPSLCRTFDLCLGSDSQSSLEFWFGSDPDWLVGSAQVAYCE